MKSFYLIDTNTRATASTISWLHGETLLTGVQVAQPHRGKGFGSQLLKQVTDDADNEGVTLVLSVEPDGTGGLTTHQLIAWYERNGFKLMDDHGTGCLAMKRLPKEQPHG